MGEREAISKESDPDINTAFPFGIISIPFLKYLAEWNFLG
jgi:hypothetical protein